MQDRANRLAAAFHDFEAGVRATKDTAAIASVGRVHALLWREVNGFGPRVGIDPSPLSGGGPKPD